MSRKGVRRPTMPICRQSLFWQNLNIRTLAIKNEILALTFGAWTKLGFEVWFRKGCGLDQCFTSVFGIVAKFPWQKFGSILPYFHGGNLAMLCLRCIIAHKILFSPSIHCENTAMEVPNFHGENPTEFHVWCAMVHQ